MLLFFLCIYLSEGYQAELIDLKALQADEAEHGTTAALICGMAAQFAELGCNIGGFNAYVTSDVLGNRAYDLLTNQFVTDKYDAIVAVLEELRDYTKYHFNHEEEYMKSINYPKRFPDGR